MNEAFLVAGARSPFGRYGGALATVRTDDLAAHVIGALMERLPTVDWADTDDVIFGCTNQAGEDNRNVARMAALLAGLPVESAGVTVNRLCGSGLDAVVTAARAVKSGDVDLVIAGGVESMTRAPLVMPKAGKAWSRSTDLYDTTIGWRFINPHMDEAYGTDPMARTAQNLADERGISREDQDAFALRSQDRAQKAIHNGTFEREIAPVTVPHGRGAATMVSTDEHPRPSSISGLSALRPIEPGWSVTAGNSAGINDGAACVLVASERAVERYGLTPLARIGTSVVTGVEPRIMGIGPVPAVRGLLARTGLSLTDIDLIELNEAFAAQSLAVLRELGLPDHADHVNRLGGAIALGHPLGASGARLAMTAALQLGDLDARHAIATMCIGVGQGIATHLIAA